MELFSGQNAAMLLVDHQAGAFEQQLRDADEVRRNVVALALAAAVLDLPVVVTTDAEQYRGELLPQLASVLPDAAAARIRRNGLVDAFADPHVDAAVSATGRRNLIVAGAGADVCATLASIHAVHAGYVVQAVADASAATTALAHDLALRRMERAGVTLTTTGQIVAELAVDFSTAAGVQLAQVLGQLRRPGD